MLPRLGLLSLGLLPGLLTLLMFRTFHARALDFTHARLGLGSLDSAFLLTDGAGVIPLRLRPSRARRLFARRLVADLALTLPALRPIFPRTILANDGRLGR